MIEHVHRYPWIRDRAIFVGQEQDIVPDTFGTGLPAIRDWTSQHFSYAGYITGFTPPVPTSCRHCAANSGTTTTSWSASSRSAAAASAEP